MKKPMVAWLLLGLLGAAAPASAQTFPSKTITIVSPAPAGGVTDIIGRGLAQRFSKAWGQQAVVENKPGANNQLAAEYIVNSPPDGHTLFIAPDGTFVANPSLYPKLPYDPYKSFTPISGLMIINHGLIEHPSFPAEQRRGADRARQAKARRDQLRHLRHRLERPSQHGAAGDHGRREAPGRALQGRGAGD